MKFFLSLKKQPITYNQRCSEQLWNHLNYLYQLANLDYWGQTLQEHGKSISLDLGG